MTSRLDVDETFRVYVRPEGGHFVGLCAELRSIITGSTVEEIVERTKALIACASSLDPCSARVAVHMAGPSASASLQEVGEL
jgi:hypothetical protein